MVEEGFAFRGIRCPGDRGRGAERTSSPRSAPARAGAEEEPVSLGMVKERKELLREGNERQSCRRRVRFSA